MTSNIFSARYAKNEIKAIYIAQEGVDYIRNLRDSIAFNHYNGGDWSTFVTIINSSVCNPVNFTKGCVIISPMNFLTLSVTTPPTNDPLPGEFRNTITTECISFFGTSSCEEIKVISKVQWKNGSVLKERFLKVSLIEWNN